MRWFIKWLVVLISIPVLLFAFGFARQVYYEATGQAEPRDPAPHGEPRVESPRNPPEQDPSPQTQDRVPRPGVGLPDLADAIAAKDWLIDTRFFHLANGSEEVQADRDRLEKMTVKEAVSIHSALLDGGKEHASLRLMFFAHMGGLDRESRREFIDQVGAAYQAKDGFWQRSEMGDYVGLFYLQRNDPVSIFAQGVRAYSEVLNNKEVIQALKQFNVIRENSATDQWDIRVPSKMGDFDAKTIMAIHDAVDKALFGKQNYLREQLADYAEGKQ
ncbi:MAG: hypothetical protein P1V35_01845 [Planctomycetota bacterium]|nr:hypothetical protein [Planctomycetota bacterium]